jgi:hypothetical protein
MRGEGLSRSGGAAVSERQSSPTASVVHEKTLQYWKYKLARGIAEPPSAALANIVEVRPSLISAGERFEVWLAGGRRIAVPPSFDDGALVQLLRVLEQTP